MTGVFLAAEHRGGGLVSGPASSPYPRPPHWQIFFPTGAFLGAIHDL